MCCLTLILVFISVFIRLSDAMFLPKFTEFIQTLSSSSSVTFLKSDEVPPSGCAVAIVNSKCDVHLLLRVSVIKILFISYL